jgi:hypothetical protein
MTTSLQSTLNDLASSFAESVLETIRGISLSELVDADAQVRQNGRATGASASNVTAAKKPIGSNGRLARRSQDDIAAALGRVVALTKKHKEGLRAEQIRAELGLQAKEMPRILKEGFQKKALKSKGQKRATTYFAT